MEMDLPTSAPEELAPLPRAFLGPWLGLSSMQPLERIGEGATSVVWRARHTESGPIVALKVAKSRGGPFEAVAREATLLARVGRRWGPALVDAGPGFVATEWVDGHPLASPCGPRDRPGDRNELAAVVAHAVGRALEELHEAGIRHGDVKPENVLCAQRAPRRDAADDRGATLIDLGLATGIDGAALGGTLRYAAPELRERGEAGPSADLWALGVLLAELLDPRVAREADPRAAMGTPWGDPKSEPARWAVALVAVAPGGRPSAGWVAARAARWLGLRPDEREPSLARVDRVRRTYLAERGRDVRAGAVVSGSIGEPARGWLESAVAWAGRLATGVPEPPSAPTGRGPQGIEPLATMRRARWLVSLVGPSAASWPMGAGERGEGELAARAVALARTRHPSSWTLEDMQGQGLATTLAWDPGQGDDRIARLVRELARGAPNAEALAIAEDDIAAGRAPVTLAVQLASALVRAGEAGRAWAALGGASGGEVDALRAEVARRRADPAEAERSARSAMQSSDAVDRWRGQATLARMAFDADDLDGAQSRLEGARGAAAAEVRALVAWKRGELDPGLRLVEQALAEPLDADAHARLEAVRGLLEWSRGRSAAALQAFGRAVELAMRTGAVVDEATYLTSEAAAATDAGDIARALASATRAALLWERLGRPAQAARAWLDRASSLATVGAAHAADEAAEEAYARALESGDVQALAYARWAQVEVRAPGDELARAWAVEADQRLCEGGADDRMRSAARLLLWAPDRIDDVRIASVDAAVGTLAAATRWEWWGARAAAILSGRSAGGDGEVLGALVALTDVAAPLGSRGPALDAAVSLATHRGDGDMARRFEQARLAAARALRDGTPPDHRASLASVAWARVTPVGAADVGFEPAQVAQLESIVRALSGRDRLRPLLEQVLDTMILWTGVERGLLLLRAPDGRLVPRAARNLAKRDLTGEQLALSQTIARRALESGDAVVATDAFATLGDLHASVHALRLRSVLALPLVARGEGLGVVYLDDRGRKGAFGPRELAWVRVLASQAAMAIADSRDAVLLRRAVRRAERARGRLEAVLQEREAELDITRTQLDLVRDRRETRYPYDEIAGRSEPMRELLRLLDRVTASDVPVLVMGESGTGKELVARAMHMNGQRTRRAFVTENCASVPETLLESTLFGHVKGAFTGASSTRAGLFDVADGGTLFLDEIGEMSLAMQAKLLRVLQDGEVRAVGGERVRTVDVRVIAATHRDLEAMVVAGKFREDLFYRLNVITLRVPALRERSEDIQLLVEHFVLKHAAGRAVKVTRAAMAKLVSFPWPGNVRQLENEVRRSLVLGDGSIDVGELSSDVVRGGSSASRGAGLDLRSRVDALESDLVVEALGKTRGNQTRAARLLGVSRFGLQKMMKRLKIANESA
jgi:transcriptional regulator with GAF, ATPase, and Fis domain/tetratricopeptide (TPR) repeat protein